MKTPKEQLLEYATTKNHPGLTDEEFCGQALIEGIVIARTPSSKTVSRITRTGKTVVVTETTITKTITVVDGKVVDVTAETVAEIMRLEI